MKGGAAVPLPKRRFSRARTRKKRAHKKLKSFVVSVCPQCKQPKLSHRICAFCGYYDTRSIIKIEKKEKKKEKK